jgi:hypothetical protein
MAADCTLGRMSPQPSGSLTIEPGGRFDLGTAYRMWATVLLHVAWRREQAEAPSYRQGSRAGSSARRSGS